MTAGTLAFQVREAWAQATLKQASDLREEERTEAVCHDVLTAVEELASSLELLWGKYRKRLQRSGISPDEASAIARSLAGAVEAAFRVLHLMAPLGKPELFRDAEELSIRLEQIEEQAKPLYHVANQPPALFDPERVRRGIEQAESGEGIDAEELLAQWTQETTP